jgi:prevent-host-death family protein
MDISYDQSYIAVMKKIAAAKFKEQCLAILDRLEPEGLIITKHGKPVARVTPVATASKDMIGSLRGKIVIKGDIESTGVRWKANA